MPFISRRAALSLADVDKAWLDQLAQSRTEPIAHVQRAQILLRYAEGETVSAVAQALHTNRPRVERCVAKALELGVRAALRDLPGRGRRRSMSDEDRTWVIDLACQKPKDLGYAQELWTTRLLAKHIRSRCVEAGHPQLQKLGRGTVSKILAAHPVKPHKIQYYLERRDPEFKPKMTEVLHVYRDVELWRNHGLRPQIVGVLSYDVQSAHISKQMRAYLASVPNRFEFIFTPKHGSWLNLIESFFGKLARTLLRGIRVGSKAELKARIELYLQEVNEEPVVFKWKYKMESLEAESVAAP
jgi:transposase